MARTKRRAVPPARLVARSLRENDPAFIAALARGLSILSLFTPDRPKLSFTDICTQTKHARSSVNRVLGTLLGLGYLTFDEETRRYMPGPRTMSLGLAALSAMDVRDLVRPHLVNLFGTIHETISYGVRDDLEVVVAERISTRAVIAVDLAVGDRLPLVPTSMGRCLLSFLPGREREAIIARLSKLHGAAQIPALRSAIDFAHREGFAMSNEEFAPGLVSVAVPVFDQACRVKAAANVALPAFRSSEEMLRERILPPLLDAARRISMSYGAPEEWLASGWRSGEIVSL